LATSALWSRARGAGVIGLEWNDIRDDVGHCVGVYDNPADLSAKSWTVMRFSETEPQEETSISLATSALWSRARGAGVIGLVAERLIMSCANTLTPNVGDSNSQTPEYKAFLVNIEKA
jgi:hypothetical protein